MKISYNWLKEYIDVDLPAEEVATLLTDCGLEVEKITHYQSVPGGLEGLIVGEVKSREKHPNADKLSITKVNVGNGRLLNIVCGAPNVEIGQKVIVAPVGTVINPIKGEPFEIKKARIRGEHSEGMLCAEDEIGLGNDHEGIVVLDESYEVGKEVKAYYDITEDTVFEIGLTPNRSDAASHIGVARDLYAVLMHKGIKTTLKIPGTDEFHVDIDKGGITVSVEDKDACPRYAGLMIEDITIAESPGWLRNKLQAIGLRPINNIVDITNFVLHEFGQPLHAFDAEEITGNQVIVKKLPAGTRFTTLDEAERELTPEDLMICNTKEGMCIAGVFGGIRSGITEKTTAMFLESACFNSSSIRRTAKHHDLKTDASFRFERGVDPNITVTALKRAAMLIKELAGGKIISEITDIYPEIAQPEEIDVLYANIDRLLGKQIDRQEIKNILSYLQIQTVREDEAGITVSVPTFKVEVTREADIIEEVLRIYGCNNIEPSSRTSIAYTPAHGTNKEKVQHAISGYLTGNGFHEIMCNSLTRSTYADLTGDSEHLVKLANPLSTDLNAMRTSLLFGALETAVYNINRKNTDLKLFEFGNVYRLTGEGTDVADYNETSMLAVTLTGRKQPERWSSGDDAVSFAFLKAHIGNILTRLGLPAVKEAPGQSSLYSETVDVYSGDHCLGRYGNVSDELLGTFDIGQTVLYAELNWNLILDRIAQSTIRYRPVPKFPPVRRDLALLIDSQITYAHLENIAKKHAGQLLREVNLFDIYEGGHIPAGKKSYALGFVFLDEKKTLTDEEVDSVMQQLIDAYQKEAGATLR